jgi:uncharacterized protein (TIGR02598 family)
MKIEKQKPSKAFTLVEVSVAMGVAAVCMFSLQALIPSTLKLANNASDQTAATTMISSITQDLRNTPAGSNVSPGFGIPMPNLNSTNSTLLTSTNFYLAEDGLGVLLPTQARYAATVTLSNAAAATVTSLTTARIKVYWPATVAASNAQGSVETVTFFNRQFQRGGTYVAKNSSTVTTLTGGPFTCNGYNQYGYNCNGYDQHGFDCNGFDCNGYNRDGFDHYGFDCHGNHEGCKNSRDNGEGDDD